MSRERDPFLISFGARVRHIRQTQNLSQEGFAQAAGLDRTYVGGIERGERNVSLRNVKRLADALNIHPQELFQDESTT